MKPQNKTLKAIAVVILIAAGIMYNSGLNPLRNVNLETKNAEIVTDNEIFQNRSLFSYTVLVFFSGVKNLILSH
jgi:hypothetical protein